MVETTQATQEDLDKLTLENPDSKKQEQTDEDVVTAFEVSANATTGFIDYDKLIQKFGCSPLTLEHVDQIGKLTGGKPHRLIRRGIFFCHRDFDLILKRYEQNQLFYLYTGRGPSAEALHLGHSIPFIINRYLQEAFDVPLVIQITDDEKFMYRPELDLETINHMAQSNIKDIIAFGFNPEKVFIFKDTEYIEYLYPNAVKVQKLTTLNQTKNLFGFDDDQPVGKFAFPPIQAVPSFCNSFPHIFGTRKNVPSVIPCAVDQDVYFRMTRDVASRLKYEKTSCFYSSFFPAFQGRSKMSSSKGDSSILLTDSYEEVKRKVENFAFAGLGSTPEEIALKGKVLEGNVPYQYLRFFLEDDDLLEEIGQSFIKGEANIPFIKELLVKCLTDFLSDFQERRKHITDEDVRKFCAVRKINAVPKKFEEARKAQEEAAKLEAAKQAAQA